MVALIIQSHNTNIDFVIALKISVQLYNNLCNLYNLSLHNDYII